MRPNTLRRSSWIHACFLGLIASCSGNTAEFAASGTISPAGGTLTVTSGPLTGTEISIPAGAVSTTVAVSIANGARPALFGFDNVGPGTNISPTGLGLHVIGSATLVFEPALVPVGANAADIVVVRQTSQGRRIFLDPTSVDMIAGTVDIDVEQFADYWVSVRTRALDFLLPAYFPLLDGDSYAYDNGVFVSVKNTSTEPNLEGIFISKVIFVRNLDEFGLYLVRDFAATFQVGSFEFPAFQEIIFPPLLWLEAAGSVGSGLIDTSFATLHEPFGAFVPTEFLDVRISVTIESSGRLTTPLGSFSDVLEVRFKTEREDELGFVTETEDTLWLARGVGPVRIEIDGIPGGDGGLISGVVAGLPIIPL